MNFVVQNLIADSLQSTEGLCQACCAERKLELATGKCRACLQTLCDSCCAEGDCPDDLYGMHSLKSLDKEQCDRHQQKMLLYCIPCQTKVCAICYSDSHQNHPCDATSNVAEKLTQTLKFGVEQLGSCTPRLEAVLAVLVDRKQKYEGHLSLLKQSFSLGLTERLRAAEDFQQQVKRRNVENFMKAKLKVVNGIIRSDSSGKVVDNSQVRGLMQDIKLLLGVVIREACIQAGRLQKLLDDATGLKTRAHGFLGSSLSAYDLAENAVTVRHLDGEIKNLIADSRQSTEGFCQACCKERSKLKLATGKCHYCLQTLCQSCGKEALCTADGYGMHNLKLLHKEQHDKLQRHGKNEKNYLFYTRK